MTIPPTAAPDLLDLAAQGVDIERPGAAYAALAYPSLDALSPADAFSLGFRDSAMAVFTMLPGFLTGVLDVPEMLARLYDSDVLST